MSNAKKDELPVGNVRIRVTVPADVARYYEDQGTRYAVSASAAAAPVLCAMARGEIKQPAFTADPGTDVRPR